MTVRDGLKWTGSGAIVLGWGLLVAACYPVSWVIFAGFLVWLIRALGGGL